MKFNVHKNDGDFSSGLRGFFKYRDLGIADATEGKVNAHVIKAVSGHEKDGSGLHFHILDFQMVYILKGWVIFKYENEGEFKLKEGDCVHQIPGIKHEEIEHSVDLEMLEITMPADFETKICD